LKKYIAAIVILLSFAISDTVLASIMCNGTKQHPCIVQDTQDNTPEVKNWRDSQMIAAIYQGNVTGLKNLWISGSAAPSEQGWKTIADNIRKATQGKVKKIIDLDLREETHGYLNHNAITLTSQYDWINLGKKKSAILAGEQDWLSSLRSQPIIYNILTSKDFKSGKFSQGINIPVESVISEEKAASDAGLQYARLTVTDHMAPRDVDVDQFVQLTRNISSDTWLHLHCRGGDGRTTTFMAMYDMLRNADKVSFDEILKRQAAVPPNYDLFEVDRGDPDLTIYYKQRLQFLRDFYQFAKASLQGYRGNWSDWKAGKKTVKDE